MSNSVRGVGQEGDPLQSFTESPTCWHFTTSSAVRAGHSAALAGVGIRVQLGSCLGNDLVGGGECTAVAQVKVMSAVAATGVAGGFSQNQPPSGNSSSGIERGAADACSAEGRF